MTQVKKEKGFFLVLEGVDGAGTTTQARQAYLSPLETIFSPRPIAGWRGEMSVTAEPST